MMHQLPDRPERFPTCARSGRAKWRVLALAGALLLLAGCASPGPQDPADPLENINRSVFEFNEGFDRAVATPIATAYRDVLPDPVRGWVRNFFANIDDVFIGLNNLLQGKIENAITDWARFGFNSTLGIFGLIDIASEAGLEKHNEDFGQTFGRWGAGSGAYIVWPFLGSSSVRDTAGLILDAKTAPLGDVHPVRDRNALAALRLVGQRADLLDASRILEQAALDLYVFRRDAYLQRRKSLIHDGRIPRDRDRSDSRSPLKAAASRVDAEPAKNVESAGQSSTVARIANRYEPRLPRNYRAVLAAD